MNDKASYADKRAELARIKERNARYELKRKRIWDMPQYYAEVVMELRANANSREELFRSTQPLCDRVAQAAMAAGDLLYNDQDVMIFGKHRPLEGKPGCFLFHASVRFVSEYLNWEQASEWLRDALDSYRDENVTVLSVEQSKAGFQA